MEPNYLAIVLIILAIYIAIYSVINRICNCFEECSRTKAYGDILSKDTDAAKNLLNEKVRK